MIIRPLVAKAAFLALAFATAATAQDDSALNKEGFWHVGRGATGSEACTASLGTKTGDLFVLRAAKGDLTFAVGAEKPMRRGKTAVLNTDVYSFDFTPGYNSKGDVLFLDDPLNPRVIAALRLARAVVVKVDGRTALDAAVEGTGFEDVLDSVLACSNGKSGWWGPGVGAERISDGPVPNKSIDDIVFNKEGHWGIATGGEPGVCVAQATVEDGRHLQILAAAGSMGLAVGTAGTDLPRGRKGRVETDGYAFDFKPEYGADSYMAADKPFDAEAMEALGRAKWVRVSVDGKPLADVSVERSGFADVLRSVAACSRSEAGWWGPGAKRP